MNTGDFVTGMPSSERFRDTVAEWVVGELEITDVDFGDDSWQLFQIHVEYEDGSDVPIDVQEDSLVETDPDSVPTSVIPLPEEYSGD